MNPLVAKRRNTSKVNLDKDYFIYGVYPYDPAFILNNYFINTIDYSGNSFNVQKPTSKPIIISHFYNSESQLEFLLFSQTDDHKSQFIFKPNDPDSNEIQEYLKQIVQIKPIPRGRSLQITDVRISSFSPKNDSLVLTDFQHKAASDFLKFAHKTKFGKISFQNKDFSLNDLCFIPALISHLNIKNRFNGPFLIVVNSEDIVNALYDDFNKWTRLKTLAIHGTAEEIGMIQKYAFPLIPNKFDTEKYHVVLTTQPIFTERYSRQFFKSLTWNMILLIDNQKNSIQSLTNFSYYGINININ